MIFDFLSNYIGFKPAKLQESTGLIPNPSRGWYQIFYFHLPQLPDFQELRWCLRDTEPVALAVIHIGAYRDKCLDPVALDAVAKILDFFRDNQKDLILRFSYDCEGKGLLHEPALFSQLEEHVRQLTPIIRAYTKTIFVLQGLFVGSWGEMHGSKFLSAAYLKRLNALAEAAAGEYTWLAARRPCQWRVLHGPDEGAVRMGLFDDGMFGSDSHLGTFGHLERNRTQWENAWRSKDELAFEERLCAKVPQGGEAVCPQPGHDLSDEEMLRRLRQMHISYLNCVYDAKLLDAWKQTRSPWSGVSLYDYVGAHLGYRFCVRKLRVRKEKNVRRLELTVENTGFAPCYEDYTVTLELADGDQTVQQKTDWDLRTVMAGTSHRWECSLPEGRGALYLSVKRKKDGRVLQFAHDDQQGGRLLLGQLT